MTLKRNNKGFTIVELLIVIVVIGILAALVITTFSGIQQRARDTERETDVKAIHGHLETFYADNGYYPSLADINDVNFRTDAGGTEGQMVGLDEQALIPPNSTQTGLAAAAGGTGETEVYGYTGDNAGATCALATEQCDNYVLTANLEGGGTYTKNALN